MPNYNMPWTKATLSTTVGAAAVECPVASMRRIAVNGLRMGFLTASGDVAIAIQLKRQTTASTATAVVPSPLDDADAACVTVGASNITVEGTVPATPALLAIAFNLRGMLQFDASPGRELIVPATSVFGLILQTPTLAGGTPGGWGDIRFNE
jgi:hypothetical protein